MKSDKPFFARVRLGDGDPCPCGGAALRYLGKLAGTGPSYGECCAPLHRGERLAETACELMAARYSAYAAHEPDYVWQTWHPRFRPEIIQLDDDVVWHGLDIDYFEENDREAVVEFRARFSDGSGPGQMRERSNFQMRGKRWMYVDGDVSFES